jgi:hypothetical protein
MFILGVGAQKAGTTWLHTQLSSHRHFSTAKAKEWHYWDRWQNLDSLQLSSDIQRREQFFGVEPGADFADHDAYFERVTRFKRVLGVRTNPWEIRADLTPAYSGLSRGVFRAIQEGFDAYGVKYRVIFMARDPLSRVISAFQMYERRGARSNQSNNSKTSNERDLRAVHFAESWGCYFRTRYDLTIQNLKAVFPSDRVKVAVTEALGDENYARKVAQFLGVSLNAGNFRDKVNAAQSTLGVSAEAEKAIAESYRETYEFMANNFPALQNSWRGFRYL